MKVLLAVCLAAATSTCQAVPVAVSKVVELLQELKARVDLDAENEQKTYDNFACWCEKVTAKKAAAIEEVQTEMRMLGNKILQLKGTVATTMAEIKQLTEDLRENEENQNTATAVRQKENSEFLAEKVELQQATAALESAMTVLRDATAGSALLQRGVAARPQASGARDALANVHAAAAKLGEAVRPDARRLAALEKAMQSYSPQSATVQGILQDMYRNFASTLETRTKDEATAHRNYEDLMATWQTEAITLRDSIVKKEQNKAEAETMLAAATKGFADDEAQIKADVAYFDATKASCVQKAEEWSARKALRADELSSISKALEILSSEDSKALLDKAMNGTSFLQVSVSGAESVVDNESVVKAHVALQQGARESQSLRLAALAAMVTGRAGAVGHFDVVTKAIDGLLATIQEEGKEDDRKASGCTEQYQKIALAVQDLQWKVSKNHAKLQKLQEVVTTATSEKNVTDSDILAVEKDMADAEAQRKEENSKFLQAKADDEQAIALLKSASEALSEYYGKHAETGPASIPAGTAAGLLQLQGSGYGKKGVQEPAPEAKFADKSKHQLESKAIVAILAHIAEDLEAGVQRSLRAEEAAQLDYEQRTEAAGELKKRLLTKKANLEETIALRSQEISQEESLKTDNEAELATHNKTRQDITPNCDWILKNLAERRRKRDLESEGLRNARAYLTGAQPLLLQAPGQAGREGDDTAFQKITFEAVSFLQRRGQHGRPARGS